MYNIENIELNERDIEKIFDSLDCFFGLNPFNEIELFSLKLLRLVKVKYIYFSGFLYSEKQVYFTHNNKVYTHQIKDFEFTRVQEYKIKKFNLNIPTLTDFILSIYVERNFKTIQKEKSNLLIKNIQKENNENKKIKKHIDSNIDIDNNISVK